MTKFIGRRYNVSLGKESTRGTGVNGTYWFPTTEVEINEKIEQVKEDTVYGVIENMVDASISKKSVEGKISGILNDENLGLLLNATMGTAIVAGPTDSAYTHTFTVLQSAQHPSFTVNISEPNATGSSSQRFTLGMVDSLDIETEVGKFPTYSMSFGANIGTPTSSTVSYNAQNNFKPTQGELRLATAYSGLATGTAYAVRKATISISKNIEDDHNIGSQTPTDRLNKQFAISGSFEMIYDSREFIDTVMLGNLTRALQIKFTNTDRTIGASTNPSLTIKLAKVKLTEVAKKVSNDDIVTQTVNFEAFYSLTDTKMADIVLINSVSTVY